MPINSYADISTLVSKVYDDALFVARDNAVMANLATVFSDHQGMAQRSRVQYTAGNAQTIGESDDMVSQAFTPSVQQTLTPGEVGLQFFLTDQRIESDPFGARNDAALELGLAMAQKIETDLLGDFSSLTGGTIGNSGSVLTWGHFFAALTKLKAQKAPMPYYCVLHPYQYHPLAKAASVAGAQTNSPAFQDEVMSRFFVGSVAGVSIFVTSELSLTGGTSATGAIFSRAALALDVRRAPRLEPERDASRRGWELNMTAVYAHGIWRPSFGVQLVSSATEPTS